MSFFRRHLAVTKLEAVVVGIIVLVLAALLMPNVQVGVSSGRREKCRDNLRQIAFALHQYHDEYGSFPPAVTYGPDGGAWHSWRVLLLPYFARREPSDVDEELVERYRLEEPWNSPHNLAAIAEFRMPSVYACPADEAALQEKTTSYVAVVGAGTMWFPLGAVGKTDASDDPAVTIHVLERVGSGIRWTEPRDIAFGETPFEIAALATGPESLREDPAGARRIEPHRHVALADGAVRFVPDGTPPGTVKSMLLRGDGGPAELVE